MRPSRRRLPAPGTVAATFLLGLTLLGAAAMAALPDARTLRRWVEEMKSAPRGPFAQIAWFCADGSVRPARAGCAGHGGGVQHGQWSDRVVAMRSGGYTVATVFADLDGRDFTGPGADLDALAQVLLERFLIEADDGWIFRAAYSYRGALQAEDEEAGGRRVLSAMLDDPRWREDARFFLLRETGRLLPWAGEDQAASATEVRQLALTIAAKDPGFGPLRIKIHGVPDAGDAARVREYARAKGKAALAAQYERLAQDIDTLYKPREGADDVQALATHVRDPGFREELGRHASKFRAAADTTIRLAWAAYLSARLRERASRFEGAEAGLALLGASLALEGEVYALGSELTGRLPRATRAERLEWLRNAAIALFGSGLITRRHVDDLRDSIRRLTEGRVPTVDVYREELRYLARTAEWAGRTIHLNFGEAIEQLAPIEPLVRLYPQDRLRGSPLLFYSAVIDSLVRDANHLAGIEHDLFGERVGVGLRALNPGLARGVIRVPASLTHLEDFARDGIYLLPETIAELPPVAGILTQGEGNSLSHVQLLARNLGIPNVVVGDALLSRVRAHAGRRAVLAVSPGGVVQLVEYGPRWDQVFGQEAVRPDFRIRPDLDKLDLETTDFVPLDRLRAEDSGRIAGPKSANLGELRHHFGAAVPDGLVIPFGAFRRLLERPLEPGGPPVFEWMRERYRAIAALAGRPDAQQRAVRDFLARLRKWIEGVDPGPDFRARLFAALDEHFGRDGTYGVFVRSDTNVEDLPGFTGAGLNLTVPNVVGREAILGAIRRVWASPFTERAYSWRQAHMEDPEYVFPAVLVQLAFPSEKSGVMVTTDVEGGRSGWLSIAVNEGVGGAVDGQAAESLLVSADGREVRVLSQATAPRRRVLLPSGGLGTAPASGTQAVLDAQEISQLVRLAAEAPRRFPALRRDGKTVPADIEFGFRGGRLALLQLRPFVENAGAQESRYLSELDARFRERGARPVALDAVPEVERR